MIRPNCGDFLVSPMNRKNETSVAGQNGYRGRLGYRICGRFKHHDDSPRSTAKTFQSSFEARQWEVATPVSTRESHIKFLAVVTLADVGLMILLPMLQRARTRHPCEKTSPIVSTVMRTKWGSAREFETRSLRLEPRLKDCSVERVLEAIANERRIIVFSRG
jgi:hypothetical protein